MKKSTGSSALDEALVNASKKWQLQPGGSAHLEVPVSFGIEGGRLE